MVTNGTGDILCVNWAMASSHVHSSSTSLEGKAIGLLVFCCEGVGVSSEAQLLFSDHSVLAS